jgi:uncharacterized phage protein gp47/JayE
MAYTAPFIDEAGLHLPSYEDVRDSLMEDFRAIYGQDIYLGNDAQDYQLLSIFALYLRDAHNLMAAIYNNRGPQTAIGSGLDGVVKLNGIARKPASRSTAVLTLTGVAGAVVESGAAQDEIGVQWLFPEAVAIGASGTASVTARADKDGEIFAPAKTITKIVTPTAGWLAVTNEADALPGQPVEKDGQLRARQTISTMLSAKALTDGTWGAIANVEGVTRLRLYENDTGTVDENTLPPHSIAAIVEGGLDRDVAEAIFIRKTPGCYTYGTTAVQMYDQSGLPAIIRFFRPIYKLVDVAVAVRPLPGFTSSRLQGIRQDVSIYLASLDIGEDVLISSLWGAALIAVSKLEKPLYAVVSVKCAFAGDTLSESDLGIAFNEVSKAGEITVEVNA